MRVNTKKSNIRKNCKQARKWLSYISMICLMMVTLWSCDSVNDFGDMNENPGQPTTIAPELQFTQIQLESTYETGILQRANWLLSGPVIQSVTLPVAPYNYYRHDQAWSEHFFVNNYGSTPRNLVDLLNRLESMQEEGEEVDNLLAATRIMRVYFFHRLTDLYGDVPYFDAGKGYTEGNFTPRYDPQSEIYADMLSELSEAVQQLDEDQPTYGDADLIYNGDVQKWRIFGNSLRLRLAMRLTEVDEQMAQEEAVAALNAPGGVMTSNDDIAYFNKMERTGQPFANGNSLAQEELGVSYITQTMVEWLRDRDDPRLSIFAAIMDTDNASVENAPQHVVSTDPADQLGLPSGYGTVQEGFGSPDLELHPSYDIARNQSPNPEQPMDGYSKLNPVMWRLNAPSIFQSYAEVALLQAEAAARGWTSGSSETYYNEGVRAALTQLSLYNGGAGTTVPESEITGYLAANPFDPANAVEQINEQYWVATFMDFVEGWANLRRSGYPELEPAKVDSEEWPQNSSTNEQWPRRLLYPTSEQDNNGENYQEAMSRQGLQGTPSDIAIPVWWDAEE